MLIFHSRSFRYFIFFNFMFITIYFFTYDFQFLLLLLLLVLNCCISVLISIIDSTPTSVGPSSKIPAILPLNHDKRAEQSWDLAFPKNLLKAYNRIPNAVIKFNVVSFWHSKRSSFKPPVTVLDKLPSYL